MKQSEKRLIYSIATAFSVLIAVTIIMLNLPAGSAITAIIPIGFITSFLGFIMTYILYQKPSQNSNVEEQPNLWIRLFNWFVLSITVIMSIFIAFILIAFHVVPDTSGH